jgi:hypothetical protein
MDEVRLQRAIITLSGVFPDEISLVKEWLESYKADAIRGALAHKEDSMTMRFLGRYSAVEDILNYMDKAVNKK